MNDMTMRVLEMLEGSLEGEPSRYRWCADWSEEVAITVTKSGFFIPDKELYDPVETGDLLGRVYDLAGNVLEELRAPSAGYVGVRRLLPTAHAGDSAFMLVRDHD